VESTLGALLDRQAARVVGRDRERSALLQLLRDDVPVVLFVHGLAGVGKSALLAAFAAEARAEGVAVVSLDGRAIEPTERGFLDALAARLGCERRPLPEVAAALGDRARRTVLAVDHYEALALLDDWLRQVLLPSLPDAVRLVLAGRDEPVSAWPAALGDLFAPLPLGNLGRVEAAELLRRAGVPAVDAARIDRIARGHPPSGRSPREQPRPRPRVDRDRRRRRRADAALPRRPGPRHPAGP
jgi:AAA ATPase-like protein